MWHITQLCGAEIGEDVSENKDEGIIRSQLKKGDGYLTPKEGATCEGLFHVIFRYWIWANGIVYMCIFKVHDV